MLTVFGELFTKDREMTKRIARIVLTGVVLTFAPPAAQATPSTTYWAPSVATCQAKYVPHVTYDTYFGKGTPPPGAGAPLYPVDTGLTMGVLPWNNVQSEV